MRLNNVRAIVFDVDGTLYAQRPVRMRILLELALQLGRNPRAGYHTLRVLRAYRRAHELVRRSCESVSAEAWQLELACQICAEDPQFAKRCIREWFQRKPLRHLKKSLHPGLGELLGRARSMGIRLGVVSDYPAAEKLAAMGIREYFDSIVSSHDLEVGLLKPHPCGLLTCLQRLEVEPDHCVYIGDRADVDLPCAVNAGTRFVLFGRPPARSDCLAISSYRQLSDALGFSAQAGIPQPEYAD